MKRILLLMAVVAAVALLGFACGDDDDDDDGGSEATSAAADGGDDTGTAGGGETSFDVEASNFQFTPADFDVPVGEPVTFNYTNNSGTSHTFTVYSDEEYTDKLGEAGTGGAESDTLEITFDTAQDYYFRCEIHPDQMKGEIAAE